MLLCIDNRERDRIQLFKRYIDGGNCKFIDGIETDNYAVSDYHTKDLLVGIEYKRDDFVPSIFNEQIDKQLRELRNNFKYPYLFIGYGGIGQMITENLGTNPDTLIGQLTSVLARHHVTTVFVGDMLVKFTCDVVEKHYDGRTKIKEIEYTPIRRTATSKEVKHAMLERIPKLGSIKVNHLLERFDNSLGNISNASIEDLMTTPGIGDILAKQIKEVLK